MLRIKTKERFGCLLYVLDFPFFNEIYPPIPLQNPYLLQPVNYCIF